MSARFRAAGVLLILLATAFFGVAEARAESSWDAQVKAPSEAGPKRPKSNSKVDPNIKGKVPPDAVDSGIIQPKRKASAVADRAALDGDQNRTSFRLGMTKGVTVEVFTLANPYRVVVDLPDVGFELPQNAGRDGKGLVSAFRYGLFAEGKARIVLDVSRPVKIEKAAMTNSGEGRRVDLNIDIVPTPADEFGAGTGANKQHSAQPKPSPADDAMPRQKKNAKPVIMIDPGHGGIDPGAITPSNLHEKNVALAVGLELRKALLATGRYEVRMTRSTDVFISLDRRIVATRQSGADLFISLHADSIEEVDSASSIRGATVYTLSERASDEQARLMAEKENASDLIAGIETANSDAADQVKGILIDLMKRETANFSAEFSKSLVKRLGKAVPLSRDPQRSAAFKVLKQTYAPAVLIELGYMTNPQDEQLFNSPEWRRKVAEQVKDAVDAHFARQTAGAP